MLGEIPKQFAERLGAMKDMAIHQPIDLRNVLLLFGQPEVTPVTFSNRSVTTHASLRQDWGLARVTVSDALRLLSSRKQTNSGHHFFSRGCIGVRVRTRAVYFCAEVAWGLPGV